jgi:large subunit ribosomal protein L30
MAQLKVTQIKSKIGGDSAQRNSLRSLGLRRIGQTVVKPDRPEFRGMIKTGRKRRRTECVRARAQAASPAARAGSAQGQDAARPR